jgi:hypothetical protein
MSFLIYERPALDSYQHITGLYFSILFDSRLLKYLFLVHLCVFKLLKLMCEIKLYIYTNIYGVSVLQGELKLADRYFGLSNIRIQSVYNI